ncbi:MAG: phospholipase A [Candidatus Eisenbacteria bacterium]|nr:phospholipase A [Candidatus Eisenbacteria bacterium]
MRYKVLAIGDLQEDRDTGLHVVYRQNSFWHLWEPSAPFFDNNYNPEAMLYVENASICKEPAVPSVQLFAGHESNGRDGATSRSWNRWGLGIDWGEPGRSKIYFASRAWRAWSVGRENADLPEYAGRGEVILTTTLGRGMCRWQAIVPTVSVRSRIFGRSVFVNTEIDATFDTEAIGGEIGTRFTPSLEVQYFSGTGENLLAYSKSVTAWRVGLALER